MNPVKIIIADDHLLFGEGMESLLKKLPFVSKIKRVPNGEEVLNVLEKENFDMIFMDIRMPVMNGIESTRCVIKKFPSVKVIALTMMEDRSNIANMFKAGASGYLLKNTSFKEVEDAIRQVAKGNKYYAKEISDILFEKIIDNKQSRKRGPYKEDLTEREREIIGLICQGFKSKDIAGMLNLSEKTVESHRTHIYAKLNIKNLVDLIYYALDTGIVTRGDG